MTAMRSPRPRFSGLTILIVEDHPDSRELLGQLLTHEGALVQTAHDGRAGLKMLETWTPDLIVADVRMPGMDGITFARRLKTDARWARVPIIALTALGSPDDLRATSEAGFTAHLTKPIDWDTLIHTIERVLAPGAGALASPPRPADVRGRPRRRRSDCG
jgi:CheY-like chemotaxis protein